MKATHVIPCIAGVFTLICFFSSNSVLAQTASLTPRAPGAGEQLIGVYQNTFTINELGIGSGPIEGRKTVTGLVPYNNKSNIVSKNNPIPCWPILKP